MGDLELKIVCITLIVAFDTRYPDLGRFYRAAYTSQTAQYLVECQKNWETILTITLKNYFKG